MVVGKEKVVMFMEELFGRVRYKYGVLWIIKERFVVFLLIFLGIVFVIIGILLFVLLNFKVFNCGYVDCELRVRMVIISLFCE